MVLHEVLWSAMRPRIAFTDRRSCMTLSKKVTEKSLAIVLFLMWLALQASLQAQADSLDKLANDFWAWRAKYAPFSGDDVNRM
jgi:hypothetical protein